MKALTFKSGNLALTEEPRPPVSDEALVRVTLSGICNTDIEITRGYSGFEGIIGHEFVGVVESSPNGSLDGKRVVGEINAGCGNCPLCASGDSRHCPTRTVLGIVSRDGCHAEYLSLPAGNLVEVPDGVPDVRAVFAEPLAAAIAISERIEIIDGDRIAVVGDGKLGILIAITLGRLSSSTVLIGKHERKLAVAREFGVDCISLEEAMASGGVYDIVVEASGSQSGFDTAMSLVRPRGAIVLKSTYQGAPTWEAWKVVVEEISIIGSRCGRLESAIALLSRDAIELERLVTDTMSLGDGMSAMRRAQEKGVLKILLDAS
jgi:threonine dehydrogenase-like Zn-dependent dehydrogenase